MCLVDRVYVIGCKVGRWLTGCPPMGWENKEKPRWSTGYNPPPANPIIPEKPTPPSPDVSVYRCKVGQHCFCKMDVCCQCGMTAQDVCQLEHGRKGYCHGRPVTNE